MATLKNTTINDTGYLGLPVGTTAQRPGSPVNGYMRYNTSTGYGEIYNATLGQWLQFGAPPVLNTEYLVVAGGGAGGGVSNFGGYHAGGGGGGAGGYLAGTLTNLNINQLYTVTVGAGGTVTSSGDWAVTSGSNSVFHTQTAIGGGGGFVGGSSIAAQNGGSGGGSGRDNITTATGTAGPWKPSRRLECWMQSHLNRKDVRVALELGRVGVATEKTSVEGVTQTKLEATGCRNQFGRRDPNDVLLCRQIALDRPVWVERVHAGHVQGENHLNLGWVLCLGHPLHARDGREQ
jgi:hypothetical protein